MSQNLLLQTAVLFLLTVGSLPHTPGFAEELLLGTEERVKAFYAYPNNCNVICKYPETLAETATHYLRQTLQREGFHDAHVTVSERQGRYFADLQGGDFSDFVRKYQEFMVLGDQAVVAAKQLQREGRWLYNWRFLLPIGLPVHNHRTLQVMNFPPLHLVMRDRDYLRSNSSVRWSILLENNGVPAREFARYITILDIAPVAAPADKGHMLTKEKIYEGPFDPYALGMLELWTRDPKGESKPVILLGKDILKWVRKNFGLNLKIPGIGSITLPNGRKVPVIAGHHPAFFYYAVRSAKNQNRGGKRSDAQYAFAFKIMKDDLIVACWQAKMGTNPSADANKTLQNCKKYWKHKPKKICTLVRIQGYRQTERNARAFCRRDFVPASLLSEEKLA